MKKVSLLLLLSTLIVFLNSCKKDKPPLPDNVLQFETGTIGFGDDVDEVTIKINLSRNTDTDIPVAITIVENSLSYGDVYTTDPAASGNKISLTIPAGSSSASFKVIKKAGALFSGEESLSFKIESAGNPVIVGSANGLELKFSAIISESNSMQLDGGTGGSEAINSVFVDLSANKQTPVKRDSWNLGFYSGSEYRVILNYMLANAMAQELDKNDLNAVTTADTIGMVLSSSFVPEDLNKVDDYEGDLTKTVIKEVSANDDDNKVYILNLAGLADPNVEYDPRESPKKWVKIRVLRNGDGYTVQYADIADTDFKTINVSKNTDYQFSYVSLITGKEVEVTPKKDQWDIEWGKFSYFTAFGPNNVYYPFSDLVFINNGDGVQAAEVLIADVSYDAYNENNIATTTFSGDRDVIGSKWRATTGDEIGVKTDRFYVIKDSDGNYYKLKFVSFTEADGGTRGKPEITYELVKKG